MFLDAGLSATARLLYIVVLAAADHVVPAKQIPALVGLPDGEAVEPFLQELDKAGLVDLGEHLGQPLATTVSPQPRPGERRSHPCVPCEGCGECSCRYMTGRCKPCDDADRAEARLRQEVARWKAQREAGATYAKGSSGARLHRWDCPSLENPDKVGRVAPQAVGALDVDACGENLRMDAGEAGTDVPGAVADGPVGILREERASSVSEDGPVDVQGLEGTGSC